MKDKKLKDHLQFEDAIDAVIFNHYSFCEIIKHIMVKYANLSYNDANQKLKESFLIEVPKSLDEIYLITHEIEFHWAMLIVHGQMYWTKGIPSDFNDFRDEYLAWEAEIRLKYNLKESYVYYKK